MFGALPLCDLFYGASLAPSAHTVDEMNCSCPDRGNSVCRRRFPNAPGPREGLPCGSTQGLFPDQDFSPQCGPQRGDLRQRAEAGLEGRARPPTRPARKMDPWPLLRSFIDFCCLNCFSSQFISFISPQTIKCLLIHPNPESALNEEAGRLLLEDYAEYESRARLITEIHAMGGPGGTSGAPPDPNDGPQPKKHAGDPTKRAGPSAAAVVPVSLGNGASGASTTSSSCNSSSTNNVAGKKKADKKRALRRL